MSLSSDRELSLGRRIGAGQTASVPGPAFDFASQWKLAAYYYQVGFLAESFEAFQRAAALAPRSEGVAKSYLGMARCLRCGNNPENALELLQLALRLEALPKNIQRQLIWEKIFAECQRDFSVSPILHALQAVEGRELTISQHEMLDATLWCYAIPRGYLSKIVPTSQMIERSFVRLESDQLWQEKLGLVRTLEACYAKDRSLDEKLLAVGGSLQRLRDFDDSQAHAIFLAAIVRCLMLHQVFEAALTALYEYREISLRMSQGLHGSLFDLLRDLNAPNNIG